MGAFPEPDAQKPGGRWGNPKADEPINVEWGAAGAGDPPVINFANRGKYGADFHGPYAPPPGGPGCEADGEGLWRDYAARVAKTNADRQRGWDEYHRKQKAAASRKRDEQAQRLAMQVSGFGRYKTAQAQRIAGMRLAKQRERLAGEVELASATTRPSEHDGAPRQRPETAPPARGSAERRIAEIEGRRKAWRNRGGMVWPNNQHQWFNDQFADFDEVNRLQKLQNLKAGFERKRKEKEAAAHDPDDIRVRKTYAYHRIAGNPNKGWMKSHVPGIGETPPQRHRGDAAEALRERQLGEDKHARDERRRALQDVVRGDAGDMLRRGGPDLRVGKNKGGAVWNPQPTFLRLMGNQHTKNMFPHGEVGRRFPGAKDCLWADPSRQAGERECPYVVRYRREEAAIEQEVALADARPAKNPRTGHGHAPAPMPEGRRYRARWPYKAYPHHYAPGGGPVPPQD